MNIATSVLLTLAACLGHFAITVWLFNRLHALGWRRKVITTLEKLLLLLAVSVLAWLGFAPHDAVWWTYAAGCWLALLAAIPNWLIPKLLEKTPAALLANDTTMVDVAERLGLRPVCGAEARLLAAFPG